MKRCLYCYQPLGKGETDIHAACSKKMFGQPIPPELPYSSAEIDKLALEVVKNHITITGVQPKISLHLVAGEDKLTSKKFTSVGLWGGYILKLPTTHYPQLPEVEDLTMHLAELARIRVVPHSLIRLRSGELAYITKRIDRVKKKKLHLEDMCQLTERLTEDKYRGSYEQIAKAILKYSVNPGLDVVNFFEQVLFSFLTGNADMHLKNFSLIYEPVNGPVLSPAYDMVATSLLNPADDEDMALTLNAKKKRLKRQDFLAAFTASRLDAKQQENIFNKMNKAKDKWISFIDTSFMNTHFKTGYIRLIQERFSRLT